MSIKAEDLFSLGEDHRKSKKSMGDLVTFRQRAPRFWDRWYSVREELDQTSADLDTIVQQQYPRNVLTLPGFNDSYLTELFYITYKDDQTEIISDPVLLMVFFHNYLDRMNRIVYNDAKNFNVLKTNITKLCYSI
jgi:hypothetical protein